MQSLGMNHLLLGLVPCGDDLVEEREMEGGRGREYRKEGRNHIVQVSSKHHSMKQ